MSCLDPEIFKNPSKVEEFMCISGMGVPFDPVLDVCGHTYCKNCYKRFLALGDSRCPLTRQGLNRSFQSVIKNSALSFLDEEEIKCPHHEKGCEWNGKVKELGSHFTERCEYARLTCPLGECLEYDMSREDYQTHLTSCNHAQVCCKFCKNDYQKSKMRYHYEQECKEKPEYCNDCKDYIGQFKQTDHAKNCPSKQHKCPYSVYNCDFVGNLKQIEEHLTNTLAMMHHISKQGEMIRALQCQLNKLQKSQCCHSKNDTPKTEDVDMRGLFD